MHPRPEQPVLVDEFAVEHPTLTLRVRAWRADDADALARAANYPEVSRWLRDRFPSPYSVDDAHFFLSTIVPASAGALHAIEINGEVAGGIGIEPGEDVDRIAGELGYWLTPAHWGQAVMARVVSAYVPPIAARLGLRRVYARVYAGNAASMRVLERAGFDCEGVQRCAVIKRGEVLDVTVYGRVFPAPER